MKLPDSRPRGQTGLRLRHQGSFSVLVEKADQNIQFDPIDRIPPGSVVALTWGWPEHLEATARAVSDGVRPTVVAPESTLRWLRARGALDGHRAPCTLQGASLEQVPYETIAEATPTEAARKAKSALLGPTRALRRLARKRGLPAGLPMVTSVRFSDGTHLLHLNLSLHRRTPGPWLAEACQRFAQPDLLIAGVDHEEHVGLLEKIACFKARRVVLADLLGDVRRSLGLPTRSLTPLVDEARRQGTDAFVLATQSTLRFEVALGQLAPPI